MAIDWSRFGDEITQTCFCRCGAEFRSHAKIDMTVRKSVSKDPCPGCEDHDNLRRVSSDPESWSLSGDKVA